MGSNGRGSISAPAKVVASFGALLGCGVVAALLGYLLPLPIAALLITVGYIAVFIGLLGTVIGGVVWIVLTATKSPTAQPAGRGAASPGWYPDPSAPNAVRYYDGRQWTHATRPSAY